MIATPVSTAAYRHSRVRTKRKARKSTAATAAYQISGFGTLEIACTQPSRGGAAVLAGRTLCQYIDVGRASSGHCHAGLA